MTGTFFLVHRRGFFARLRPKNFRGIGTPHYPQQSPVGSHRGKLLYDRDQLIYSTVTLLARLRG